MSDSWIDSPAELEAFCKRAEDARALALDTESDHFHAYDPRVCLLQVATRDEAALVDPLALDQEALAPLFERLADPDQVVILHSARNDIGELTRDFEVTLRNLFDTQVAARFLDYGGNSLDFLLAEIAGVEATSSFQLFDWTRRPIPDEPRRYALDDVLYLHELRDHLAAELDERGWTEPFRQYCAYLVRSHEHRASPFEPGAWRDVRGMKKLDGRGRAVLRELFALRHQICRRLNCAPVHCFSDAALVELARRRPTSTGELRGVSGMVAQIRHEDGDAIVEAVERGLGADMPPKRRPDSGRPERPPRAERERYNALRRWRNDTAERLGLPPLFIATNDTLARIAHDRPETLDQLARFDEILDWHLERFGDEVLERLT
jgi:ribonuclease D